MRLNLHFFEELLYSEEDRATKRAPSVPLTQRGTTKLPNIGLTGPSEPPATRTPSLLRTFDMLYSEKGYENLKSWFLAHSGVDNSLSEDQFLLFLRKLTDFHDHRILELFDLFDVDDLGSIAFSEFFLIVALLAGLESGKSLNVLHRHAKQLFKVASNCKTSKGTPAVEFVRMCLLLRMIGVSEEAALANCRSYNINTSSVLDFDEFVMFSFILFSALDDQTETSQEKTAGQDDLSDEIKVLHSKNSCFDGSQVIVTFKGGESNTRVIQDTDDVESQLCSLHVLEEDARAAPCPRCGQKRLKDEGSTAPLTPKMEQEHTSPPLALLQLFSQASGPDPSVILDFLYLGSMFGVQNRQKLLHLEWDFLYAKGRIPTRGCHIINILNVADEIENCFPTDFYYKKYCFEDDEEQDLMSHFEETNRWIEQARTEGELVIVHCAAGVSRSATIIIAYLMKHKSMTLRQAFDFVREKRPVVNPNSGFLKQLCKYEEKLYGKNSVLCITELDPSLKSLSKNQGAVEM
ncbi:hypothetical protein PROFUN_07784 [Planoprotostelium fungivorum]|uniref:Uncharacterized protein n=1 Tax=Planoprotostelium fungivorum TaxID=1890364 RepID=A0A2P6MX12_9EUKA|nr:hypothetical protein PROFUN_07784 [Planoprotostelium fungivorum]